MLRSSISSGTLPEVGPKLLRAVLRHVNDDQPSRTRRNLTKPIKDQIWSGVRCHRSDEMIQHHRQQNSCTIKVAGDVLAWIHDALDALSAVVASLEPAIAVDALELPWEHADPSDRIIVATARRLCASLVTADTAILTFASSTKAVRVLEL
jgi:PIN domain